MCYLKRVIRGSLLLALALVPGFSQAQAGDVLDRLNKFSTQLSTFTADFEQTLYDADSAPVQVSTGTVILKRPGRFIWRYDEPESQQFVADGSRLWLYDKELEQVTVNALDERVSGTPLVLLMGTAPLAQEFTLSDLGTEAGIDWVELLPKDNSADFEALYIGLQGDDLAAMELRDNFGQATQIIFSDFQADVALDDAQFEFVVPAGVDVIGLGL